MVAVFGKSCVKGQWRMLALFASKDEAKRERRRFYHRFIKLVRV